MIVGNGQMFVCFVVVWIGFDGHVVKFDSLLAFSHFYEDVSGLVMDFLNIFIES
jgi:hypothetical protein